MKAIEEGFTWLIDFFVNIWEFLESIMSGLILAFRYVFIVVELALNLILNLPDWLQAFGIITISITAVYFVIGRSAGNNESGGN